MENAPKSYPISLRLSREVLDALKARARDEDRPVAAMAAHIVKAAVLPGRK